MYHTPVLLHQSVEGLNIKPDGIYVDVTFGGGGHSAEILNRLERGRLLAFDQDEDASKNLLNHPQLTFLAQNFRYMRNFLMLHGAEKVDGILADLGVSSYQFDKAKKGFSTRLDGPLDMRMDQNNPISAYHVVNDYDESDLSTLFHRYGELDRAKHLAEAIVKERQSKPIETTSALKKAVAHLLPRGKENKVLAQIFQALRIEVNQEIEVLKIFLEQTPLCLKPGGRLVVIAYHSLEDRLVKNFMKTGNFDNLPEKDFFGNQITPFRLITRKPINPDENEVQLNPRARSARLRIAEKI
jgi:16S rRNA (cytosine1402-N4)-methyltransferase